MKKIVNVLVEVTDKDNNISKRVFKTYDNEENIILENVTNFYNKNDMTLSKILEIDNDGLLESFFKPKFIEVGNKKYNKSKLKNIRDENGVQYFLSKHENWEILTRDEDGSTWLVKNTYFGESASGGGTSSGSIATSIGGIGAGFDPDGHYGIYEPFRKDKKKKTSLIKTIKR